MAHDHAPAAHDHKADARAAFMGLIFGAIALLAMVVIIVTMTNRKFAAHAAAEPAHETAAPAATTPAAAPATTPTKAPH
jgi:hypothetical protein